ncbi:hypothetical protein KY284_030128 [Solanum tuberosum]|nr:hypothetical protein KY284_030128 [Solanum tuberosum]
MPLPVYNEDEVDYSNRLIRDEMSYNKGALTDEHQELLQNLTDEQKAVYKKIMSAVITNSGGFFFLYGFGGTGKTFIWRTLSAAIRSKGDIVLTVASSGIASLLLPGGRTSHSRFVIPLNINEDSTCNIKQGTPLANLIVKAKLIIWDEAPMMHKYCFEALDKTLRDIISYKDASKAELPFGEKTVVLEVGDGSIGSSIDGIDKVLIPNDLLINEHTDPIASIVESIYPDFITNCNDPEYIQQRAILAPTLDMI